MDDTTILGISAKKQGGKGTSCNFMLGAYMSHIGLITEDEYKDDTLLKSKGTFTITSKGELWVSNIDGNTAYQGIFDYERDNDTMREFKRTRLDPYIKIYSFADMLKRNVCMNVLGLTYEQCYGTDADKETVTHLCWENMPENQGKHGFMTAREVMQFVGTDLFRKMYGNVWVDATIRQIKKDKPVIAIAGDCRFPNEVDGVHTAGGKVIRYTRAPFAGQDEHLSENALNEKVFDQNKFDAILDNSNSTISQQNKMLYNVLTTWGMIPTMRMPSIEEQDPK